VENTGLLVCDGWLLIQTANSPSLGILKPFSAV
jgi:hypothetical protein